MDGGRHLMVPGLAARLQGWKSAYQSMHMSVPRQGRACPFLEPVVMAIWAYGYGQWNRVSTELSTARDCQLA